MRRVEAAQSPGDGASKTTYKVADAAVVVRLGDLRLRGDVLRLHNRCVACRGKLGLVREHPIQQNALLMGHLVCQSSR